MGQSITTIDADLDHFKQITDTYGHGAGAKVTAGTGDDFAEKRSGGRGGMPVWRRRIHHIVARGG